MNSHVRVAVIDSGAYAAHPHLQSIAGGVSIAPDGHEEPDYTDRIGHGTAVAAAIGEKAPEAEIYAVKIFHQRLATRILPLVRAIEWCAEHAMHFINLSLGTTNPEHESMLSPAVEFAVSRGIVLVSAYEDGGRFYRPGCMPGATPVALDWDCPRDEYRTAPLSDGRILYRASGYPRPIPGVSPEQNLKGISFAVANVTGLLAARFTNI
jgi:subtilisin family serine protease